MMSVGRWRTAIIALGFGLLAASATAAVPTFEHILPAGFAKGSTNQVTVAGKFDPWPPKVWTSCTGLVFTAETNKGKFRVETTAAAPVGAHLMRLFNDEGATEPRIFVVSDGPELVEAEPNDHFTNAQAIATTPSTVNGRLDKSGDVDSFKITAAAGQWLDAQLDAYVLASKMDALLRVATPDGVQQAWNHDYKALDPRLIWQAPTNGDYIVQVMGFKYPADAEVRLTGGDGCTYRLHLAARSAAPKPFAEVPEEAEPNDSPTNTVAQNLPLTRRGTISAAGDEDVFAFELKKDETIEVSIEAAAAGSSLDALLRIADASGKELVRNDDSAGRDPRVEWKAATNGVYFARVSSLLRRGGADHYYKLSAKRAESDCRVRVTANALTFKTGTTNDLKFTVNRLRGFDHKLRAELRGLPAGARAEPLDFGDKAGEQTLKIVCAADAPAAQAPVRLIVVDTATSREFPAEFEFVSSSENNGVPGGYTTLLVESTAEIWLTIQVTAKK